MPKREVDGVGLGADAVAIIVSTSASTLLGVSGRWYTRVVPATSPRIQVTVDPELDAALSEFAGSSRSRAVRDLAVRGAQALREEKRRRHDALQLLQRIAEGEDDRYDFSVSAELHAARG